MSDPAMILDAPYHKLTDGELLIMHADTVLEIDRLIRNDDQVWLKESEWTHATILEELRSRALPGS